MHLFTKKSPLVIMACLILPAFSGCLRVGPLALDVSVPSSYSATGREQDVRIYGAVGDGKTDCTGAFQAALDAAALEGGIVFVPAGRYMFQGTLVLPQNVVMEGVWRAPQRGEPVDTGSVLYATAGKGEAEGTPFLRMSTGSTLKGISIYYPEQVRANPPIPYPWTIQSNGAADTIAVRDVTLINSYQGVDFGSYPAGRHWVNGLYGHPLHTGIYINQCYDVGRIENIHFWPFWDLDPNSPLWAYTREHGTAFLIGKTDGQMGHNLFSIFYRYGMRFIAGPIYDENRVVVDNQAGSGMYSNCYMDVSPCAIRVDSAMDKAGISFVNGSFMSRVEVGPNNRGQVKFTGCGFWAVNDLKEHAVLEGRGAVFFESCHFSDWDRMQEGAPCIAANNQRLLVNGCEFPTEREKPLVLSLGPRIRSAVITANLMPGGENIVNNAPASAAIQIANNAVEPSPNFISEWLLLGPFPNAPLSAPLKDGVTRSGFHQDYLLPLGGERNAILTETTVVSHLDDNGKEQKATTRICQINPQHKVDVMQCYGAGVQVAYAFTYVYAAKKQNAWFDAGMNDGGKIYVNGELFFERFTDQGRQCTPASDLFRAYLQKGWNPVLVKLEDGGGRYWEFMMEIYGEDGNPLRTSIHPEK